MNRVFIGDINRFVGHEVELWGWLQNKRSTRKLHFLQVRDGSTSLPLQGVVSLEDTNAELFSTCAALQRECSLKVRGTVAEDPRAPLGYELQVSDVVLVGSSVDFPISKKAHGDAFLLDHRHLWLRSRRQHAILRIRHTLIRAIRDYFDAHGFTLVDSPILTPNACEGTSTLFCTPYFAQEAYLTQSGQLYQEAACMAFGKSYCFGPTFRAEKSKTRRHLSEFWMVEPEVAYADLGDIMDLAEDFLCAIVHRVLGEHEHILTTLLERDLTALRGVQKPFPRISYDDALAQLDHLRNATADPGLRQSLALTWGDDFGSPHETELSKRHDRPIMVHSYPAAVKAFYMKRDAQNPALARCVDVLAPEGYGEIIGGGQREDDAAVLDAAIAKQGLPHAPLQWFLDLRRYGTVPHAGFGLGVERCVAWICGLHHVRETIPFPRTIDRLSP